VDALPDDLATLFMLEYDPATRILQYTNAGHVPGLLLRPGATEPMRLTEGGLLLGVSSDVTYVEASVQLVPGDVLVLYTDGVTDSHDLGGRAFTESRLSEVIRGHCGESAERVRDAIYRTIVDFRESNEQFDDLTLLVMKIE
jgi:sigma-B regulation protein RsbU (phosphoserine phosphatase)